MENKEIECVYPEVGERIRRVVKKLGITQKELIKAAAMSKTTLQGCLKGGMSE